MRRENKESMQSFILSPGEEKSIRCKNALNRELKINKSRKNCIVAIRENLVKETYLGYVYKFTKRLNNLTFDIALTDDTGRLKEYRPSGDRYRIKSHLIHTLIKYKIRNHFTLFINDVIYPALSLHDIQLTDTRLKIKKNGVTMSWVYYTDIKSLEVL